MRDATSEFLSKRSSVRHEQYPTRSNSLFALIFIALVLPVATVTVLWVAGRSFLLRRRLRVAVLAVDSEFAPVIELLEFLRSTTNGEPFFDYVLVLSKYRHRSLDALYSKELKCPIIRGRGVLQVVQQSLMLQPNKFVELFRLRGNRTFKLCDRKLEISDTLLELRHETLARVELSGRRYVAMAVYTLQYDEERNSRYAAKTTSLETKGNELTEGVRYLQEQELGVILLGSEDTRNSRIPVNFPRLSDFGCLGGPHELAIASGCEYFWNDSDVGAWWLALPFRKPILTTNKPRMRLRTDFSDLTHLVVPTRYRRPDGTELTIREMLSMKSSPLKAASRGELEMIRNSADEIVQAHREIMDRISNPEFENKEASEVQLRSRRIFEDFPGAFPMRISTYFLLKHSHLLN